MAKIVIGSRGTNKINELITAKEVRVVGSNGQQLGIMPTKQALELAASEHLDLVTVSEEAQPPVCKILDYGKYKYDLQKKKVEAKKKQKTTGIKEIQLRPFIGENDLKTKCKAIQKFIEGDNKVKLVLRFRGREMSKQQMGFSILNKIIEFCADFAKCDCEPKMEGSILITFLTKKKK